MPQVCCSNPDCGESYRVSDESLGTRARCKKCGTIFELSLANGHVETETPGRSGASETRQATKTELPKRIGRFQILGVLGSGGFGIVYRARDTVLKREVALKVPNLAGIDNDEKVNELATRFLREAEAVAQLHHPHIVPIFDTGDDGTNLYQASKLIEGTTLKEAFQQGNIDRAQTVTVVRQLAEALAYAHEQGIIHRDVKPANVMLDQQGHPYLMDFGLARIEETQGELTQDASQLGTPLYMSPEQASGEKTHKVGPASDQYSLGVVLYELLTGKKPFDGAPQIVLHSILTKEPESLRSINRDLAFDLETICQKAMAKEPGRRYGDCGELAEDLRRYLNDEPIQARQVGLVEITWRWTKRNPVVSSLISAVALLFIVIAVVAGVGYAKTSAALERADQQRLEAERQTIEAENSRRRMDKSHREMDESRREAIKQFELAKYQTCISQIRRVESDIRANDFNSAHNTLSKLQDTHDFESGFEIDILNAAISQMKSPCDREVLISRKRPLGMDACINSSCWRVAFRSGIYTWDPFTESVPSLHIFTEDSYKVEFSDDHKTAVTLQYLRGKMTSKANMRKGIVGPSVAADKENTPILHVWDLNTGELRQDIVITDVRVSPGQLEWPSIAISHDGVHVAFAYHNYDVLVWNVETGRLVLTANDTSYTSYSPALEFIPHTTKLVVATSRTKYAKTYEALILDVTQSGESIALSSARKITSLSCSSDGQLVAAGLGVGAMSEGEQGAITVWDTNSGKVVCSLGNSIFHDSTDHITFRPNSHRLLSIGSYSGIAVWDIHEATRLGTITVPSEAITNAVWDDSGQAIAVLSKDNSVWRLPQYPRLEKQVIAGHARDVRSVKFTSDETHIISASARRIGNLNVTGSIRITDLSQRNGKTSVLTPRNRYYSIDTDSEGRLFYGNPDTGAVVIHDLASGKTIRVIQLLEGVPPKSIHSGRAVASIDVSPDGQRVAVSGRMLSEFSGVYSTETGKKMYRFGTNGFVKWSPDGSMIAVARGDAMITLYKANNGDVIHALRVPGKMRQGCVAFSPNGKWLASGDGFDRNSNSAEIDDAKGNNIHIWDLSNSQHVAELRGHSADIRDLEYSSNGSRLFSASVDGTIRIWDTRTWQQLIGIGDVGGGVWDIDISPSGNLLAAGCRDGTIRIWGLNAKE